MPIPVTMQLKTVLDKVKAVILLHSHESIITANQHSQSLTSPYADFNMS